MADDQAPNQAAGTTDQKATQFNIERIYTKDISFETPNSPNIFKKEWKPEIKLDVNSAATELAPGAYEVVLTLTATASLGEETAFLCEVQQAGIFGIGEMPEQNKAQMIGAFCPNILFPYARETIASLVNRGSFPQLNLAPVNFDAIFAAYMQKRQEQANASADSTKQLDS